VPLNRTEITLKTNWCCLWDPWRLLVHMANLDGQWLIGGSVGPPVPELVRVPSQFYGSYPLLAVSPQNWFDHVWSPIHTDSVCGSMFGSMFAYICRCLYNYICVIPSSQFMCGSMFGQHSPQNVWTTSRHNWDTFVVFRANFDPRSLQNHSKPWSSNCTWCKH